MAHVLTLDRVMVAFIILLVVVGGLAYRVSTAEDRERWLRQGVATFKHVRATAAVKRQESAPFRDLLRARTPWPIVTLALAMLNGLVFAQMLFGQGSLADSATLLSWGASIGPRTTNGEWWLLVTSMFVHAGLLQVAINVAAIVQLGFILERLVGRPAFAGVYLAAGIFSSLMTLSSYPIDVSYGASGAIFGLYGFLMAATVWGIIQRPPAPEPPGEDVEGAEPIDGQWVEPRLIIPLMIIRRLVPFTVLFVLYSMMNGSLAFSAELAGLVVGLVCGAVLAKDTGEAKAPTPRITATLGPALVLAAGFAITLRGIADVKPEIARVVALEDRTASAYQNAVDRFKKGRMTTEGLAQLIDKTIVPELQSADERLKALRGVPAEHKPIVADAEEYLRLRSESWRLRAEGLRKTNKIPPKDTGGKNGRVQEASLTSDTNWRLRAEAQYRSNMVTLGKAEGTERASLEALKKVKLSAEQLEAQKDPSKDPSKGAPQ